MKKTCEFRKWRQSQNLSLKDIAQGTGFTVSVLASHERGTILLDAEQLYIIANAYDTTIAHLIGGDTSNPIRDRCWYCGRHYHPMPVWSRGNQKIWVCNDEVWRSVNSHDSQCNEKALAAGYQYRRDLTLSR